MSSEQSEVAIVETIDLYRTSRKLRETWIRIQRDAKQWINKIAFMFFAVLSVMTCLSVVRCIGERGAATRSGARPLPMEAIHPKTIVNLLIKDKYSSDKLEHYSACCPSNDTIPRLALICNSNRILLASASPRRSALLQLLGVEFTVGISEYPENQDWHIFPSVLEYVVSNAQNKLNFALEKFPGHDIVIAADTVVEAHGAVYEKPTDSEDTKRMMRLFSGTSHHVHTALVVASRSDTGYTTKVKTVTTLVEFDVLEETSIEAYGNTKEWEGKAGGYGIQMGGGGSMIKSITGCYYNIMGFPINAVANALREVALEHLQST